MAIIVNHTHTVAVSAELAWRTLHEQLPAMAPWLPHVARIEVLKERPISDRRSSRDYAWHVQDDVVPGIAKPFLRDHMQALHSTTLWHHDQQQVELQFYLDTVPGLLDCSGHFALIEEGEGTLITLQAEITIQPDRLPGLPSLVGKGIRPTVERVVEDALRPALEALPEALEQLLAQTESPV